MTELEAPDIWQDPEQAQLLGRERASLAGMIDTIDHLTNDLQDASEMLAIAEGDAELVEVITEDLAVLEQTLSKFEFRRMFSGQMDANNAFLDIQSGSGGTEAQDWANMLLRMYLRWGEQRDFVMELIEVSPGEVAGIKVQRLNIRVNMLLVGYARKLACIVW